MYHRLKKTYIKPIKKYKELELFRQTEMEGY